MSRTIKGMNREIKGFSPSSQAKKPSSIDDLNMDELNDLKIHLEVKTRAKTKAGLKKAINNHLLKDKKASTPKKQEKPMEFKTLDDMSLAELRVVASRHGVKSGGIKKDVLKRRITKEQAKLGESDDRLQNLPSGHSITRASYDGDELESDFDVNIIDKDVEPHKSIIIDDQGQGVYRIEQTTALGEQEVTIVTITDSEQGIKNKLRFAELEKQVKLSEPKILSQSEVLDAESKTRKIQKDAYSNSKIMSDFEYDLYRNMKAIDEEKRRGGMITLPELRREMSNYSREDFDKELFRLESERKIDLQTASDHKLLKEPEQAIIHPSRGYINYVLIRREWESEHPYSTVPSKSESYPESNNDSDFLQNQGDDNHDSLISEDQTISQTPYEDRREFIIGLKENLRTAKFQQEESRKRKEWNQEGKAEEYAKDEQKNKEWAMESERLIQEYGGHTKWVEMDKQELSDEMASYRTVVLLKEEADKQKVLKSDDKRIRSRKNLEEKIQSNIANRQALFHLGSDDWNSEVRVDQDPGSRKSENIQTITQKAKAQAIAKKKRKKRGYVPPGKVKKISVENPLISDATINYPKSLINDAENWKKNKKAQAILEKIGSKEFEKRTKLNKTHNDYLPNSWLVQKKQYERLHSQEAILEDYKLKQTIPLYIPIKSAIKSRASNDLINLKDLDKLEKVEAMAEKPPKGIKSKSLGGQNLQASIDEEMNFRGLYFQDGSQKNPLPHFAQFDYIIADNDDTGHYSAYMLNYYIKKDPELKNVDFGHGKLEAANKKKAMRFFAKQIINSSAYRRNLAVKDIIEKDLDASLTYRNSSGDNVDFTVSEQKLAISNYLYKRDSKIIIIAPEISAKNKRIVFDFETKNLPDNKEPILAFEWSKKEFQPLDSDTLLQVCVKEFDLEPDYVQATLEQLYFAGWINYPRADQIKATDEPIFTLRPIEEFKGTEQEKRILRLIDASESSNYIKNGDWVLRYDDEEIARTDGYVLGETDILYQPYTHQQFDISVQRAGMTKEELTKFLIQNRVNTPATRTMQLRAMKEAGIISLVERDSGRVYQLDKRGVILKAAYDFYKDNSFDALKLLKEVDNANSTIGFQKAIAKITPMPRDQAAKLMKVKAESLLEAQDDLAELESF